jgi:HK97 family phage major capsid protein
MPGIDVYRGTSGVQLPPQVSQQIWTAAQEQSAIMQAAQQINLPGAGVQIPIITGDPQADWVSETDEKPVSRPSFSNKTITAYTLAVIVPFSNQFRRDLGSLYAATTQRLPLALAKKFDQTVFGPEGGRPGSDFDTLGAAATVGIAGSAFAGLIAAQTAVATYGPQDGDLTGWVLSPAGRASLMGALDTTGRPLLDLTNRELLGAPTYRSRTAYSADADGAGAGTAKQLGFAGDWSMAYWGSVEGVSISISDQATLTDTDGTVLNLWQRNMFAVRAEIEIGFRVRDLGYFVKLTDAAQA